MSLAINKLAYRSLALVAILSLGFAAILGSGGGDGGDAPPAEQCSQYMEITYPTELASYSTVYENAYLQGSAFEDTIDPAAVDTGVEVTWLNLMTGLSGDAIESPKTCCLLFTCWTCGTLWSAHIPLQVGNNLLELRASSASKCGIDTVDINRLNAYALSGMVRKDDGSAYPGVTISITGDLADSPQTSVQTDNNGNYQFSRIPVGSHTLSPSTACNSDLFTPATRLVNVTFGDVFGLDFVATPNPATYSVSGTLTYQNATPVVGAPLIISNNTLTETALTDATGGYSINNVPIGIYDLRPDFTNYASLPEFREATLCVNDLVLQNFVMVPISDVMWNKRYTRQDSEYATAVEVTADNQIVITGVANDYEQGANGWAIKLDENGRLIWQRSLGRSGTYPCWGAECPYMERLHDIALTADGGFVMAGQATEYGGDSEPWLVKLDSDGNIIWQRIYTGLNVRGEAQAIQRTDDNNLIVAGKIGHDSEAIWLAKLATNGTLLWQQAYIDSKATPNTGKATAYAVHQTNDGGYILSGSLSSYYYLNNYHNGFMLKVDSNGVQEWVRSFADSMGLFAVTQTADGHYLAAGERLGTGLVIIKLNADGSTNWYRTFQSTRGTAILETPDDHYLVSTTASLLKLNVAGDVVWHQPYATGAYIFEAAATVMQDGRYLAVHADSPALDQIYDIVASTYQDSGANCPGTANGTLTPSSGPELDGGSALINIALAFTEGTTLIAAQNTNAVEESECWSN